MNINGCYNDVVLPFFSFMYFQYKYKKGKSKRTLQRKMIRNVNQSNASARQAKRNSFLTNPHFRIFTDNFDVKYSVFYLSNEFCKRRVC